MKWVFWLSLVSSLALAEDNGGDSAGPLPLSVYSADPAIEYVSLSLSGKFIAIVTTINGTRLLAITEVGGGLVHSLALGDLNLTAVDWAGDDFVLVRTRSAQNLGYSIPGHRQLHNVLVVNRRTGSSDVPLSNSKKVLNAAFGFHQPVQKKGRWYQCVNTFPTEYSVQSRKIWIRDFDPQLTCIDLETGRFKTLAGGREDGDGWLLGPELEVLAMSTYDSVAQQWQLKRDWREAPLVDAKSRYGGYDIVGQGAVAGSVVFSVNDETYYQVALGGGEVKPLLSGELVESLVFDPITGLNTGYRRLADVPELVMFDPVHQARLAGTRKAFPNLNVSFKSWDRDLNRLVVYTDGNSDSGTWWLVDIAKGTADILGSNYPAVTGARVAPFSMWDYRAADGLPIHAVVTRPPGGGEAEDLPLIVLPHGGPESRDYLNFDWIAQALASRGYVVLQPNFRGSDGYGVDFRNAGFGEFGRKMQTDLSDGVAALAKTGLIDPSRVSIVGLSYGGYAALAGVTLQQGIYRCAVSIAGISDLTLFLSDKQRYRMHSSLRYWTDYLGVATPDGPLLKRLSPWDQASKETAPILLIHGEYDNVVPKVQSERMASRLKALKVPSTYLALAQEDHYLSHPSNRERMLEATLNFVMEHNPPGH